MGAAGSDVALETADVVDGRPPGKTGWGYSQVVALKSLLNKTSRLHSVLLFCY